MTGARVQRSRKLTAAKLEAPASRPVRSQTVKPLFGTGGALFVLFLHRGKTLLVRYRWNERFLSTIDGLNASAGDNYKHDDEMAARAIIVMARPTYGSADTAALAPAAYFDVETDGSLSEFQPSARVRSEPQKVTNPCPMFDD